VIESKRISADSIPECFAQLLWGITKAENEFNELYDQIHNVKQKLFAMKYKRSLMMKLYLKKIEKNG